MTDFFSRIFAIPSDESSSYTPKPSPRSGSGGGGGGGGGHAGGRTRKGTTANGNGDGDEATLSLLEGEDGRRRPGRGSSQSSESSRTSTSSETAEDRRAGGERAKGSPRTPSSSAGAASPAAAGGGSPRGRQRRDRDPGGFGRSASEQPRGTDGKKYRSSSMSMASSQRRAVSSTGGMQLHMSSPKGGGGRRHRSLSKMGSRNSSSRGDSRTGGAAARANSWSEGEEEDEGRRRARSSSQKGSGGRTRSGDRRPKADGHTSSEKARKEKEKKDKHGWRSRFSRKRHSPGATMAAEGTPPQHPPVKSKAKSKPKSALDRRDTPQSNPEKSGGGGRVRRSSSGRLPSVNINVGDSVVISQQFLEENAEMSVLTLPKELRGDGDSAVAADFDQCIQEVGRRAAIENYRVQEFLERAAGGALCAGDLDAGSASTYGHGLQGLRGIEAASRPRVPAYDGVGAYASRALEEGDLYPSYSRDDRSEGRRPPCDPSAEGHSPQGEGDEGQGEDDGSSDSGSIPPPPPPPTPPPRSGRPPKSPTKQPTSHAVSPESSAPAVPHWNTPADGSGSVATSYNDPPGMLVTSPTLGAAELSPPNHRASADPPEGADPPEHPGEEDRPLGDEAEGQPFDEGESGLGSPAVATETLVVPRKAVTFALPPPSSSPVPPAPPFLGPPLDCYFSAERDDPDGPPPFRSTALGILPPIVELWSPVEEAVGAVAGNDVGWDEEKEDELLGEERPLRVSAEFIDILERELEQPQDEDEEEVEDEEDEATFAGLSPAHPIMPETNGDAFSDPSVDAFAESTQKDFPDSNSHAFPPNRLVGRQISAASAPSNWDEDLPHDEYFDDILNCGDDLLAGEAIGSADNGEDQWEGHPVARDSVSAPSSDARRELEGDDVDLRHRSMWNAAYRPPKLFPPEGYDLASDPALRDGDRGSPQWQRLVRVRNGAAVAVQRHARGVLERQRLRRLIEAVLVLQRCARRYLARKRHLEYVRLKRSYFPSRWKRINMSVAI